MIYQVDKRIYDERKVAKENKIPVLRDASFDLLMTTVAMKAPKRILEIGTAWGHSGIAMLMTSPTSHLTGIEFDPDAVKRTKENYKKYNLEDRTTLFAGDANEIIPLLTGPYDFIFLDGPKGHYYEYLPYLLGILSVGGVIFADNINFQGYILGDKPANHKYHTIIRTLKQYVKAVTEDENLATTVLDIEDGVAISVKMK